MTPVVDITLPPFLKPGDRIGLVCPSGYMPREKTDACVRMLKSWGYEVQVGPTVGAQHHYFSSTDEERLADLQAMLDDPSVHAILCARGGYGMSRIIDRINLTGFKENPKWICGFSDVTLLHQHLLQTCSIASLHSTMASAFNEQEEHRDSIGSFRALLTGGEFPCLVPAHPMNRSGQALGRLTGGNLSLLAHACGSVSEPDTGGAILFLEDVGEYLYNLDRMMLQLKRAGKLDRLAGLAIGGFTEMKDTQIPFGQTAEEIIESHIAEYEYPVCFGLPVSHGAPNVALIVGGSYRLEVTASGALLEQSR